MTSIRPWIVIAFTALASCSEGEVETPIESSQTNLQVELRPGGVAFQYLGLNSLPAGVAGGRRVVFTGLPMEGRVVGFDRLTGVQVGELPPPADGFVLGFMMASQGEGRVAVLDAGGLPSPIPFVPANPRIYEYDYGIDRHGHFWARLARTVRFDGILVGFAESFVVLEGGRYAVSDAVMGAILIVEGDGTVRVGVGPRSPAPEDGLAKLRFCPDMPTVTVGGLPFRFTGGALPGVSPLAVRGGTLYYHSSCAGGVYSIPLLSLFDHRQPWERADDIRLVSPQPPDVQVEELMGLNFNPYDWSDPYLYAADALQLRIVRIDPRNGHRRPVADDPELFDFPSSTAFLPPLGMVAPLVVVSNQQERLTLTNDAITEDVPRLPFVLAKVLVSR